MQDNLILRRLLCKLWNIEQTLERNANEIKEQSKVLVGLRNDKAAADDALDGARRAQATARTVVATREKRLKKAEKALEARVCFVRSPGERLADRNGL